MSARASAEQSGGLLLTQRQEPTLGLHERVVRCRRQADRTLERCPHAEHVDQSSLQPQRLAERDRRAIPHLQPGGDTRVAGCCCRVSHDLIQEHRADSAVGVGGRSLVAPVEGARADRSAVDDLDAHRRRNGVARPHDRIEPSLAPVQVVDRRRLVEMTLLLGEHRGQPARILRDGTEHVDGDLAADRQGREVAQRVTQLRHRFPPIGELCGRLRLGNARVPKAGERPIGCGADGWWWSVRWGHRTILPPLAATDRAHPSQMLVRRAARSNRE